MNKIKEFKNKFKLVCHLNFEANGYGMDTYEMCKNKSHFNSYPYKINYKFNSMGFRDKEIPSNLKDLTDAIWCIGDSFTVGLGSPLEHTWVNILQQKTNKRCINISMDGASNEWISMLAVYIIKNFNPTNVACCWSYPERRLNSNPSNELKNKYFEESYNSIKDPNWPECKSIEDFNKLFFEIRNEVLNEHELPYDIVVTKDCKIDKINLPFDLLKVRTTKDTSHEDLQNMVDCLTSVKQIKQCTIVHSFIPKFCNNKYIKEYKDAIQQVVKNPIYIEHLDYARDGHHFDILTSKQLVKNIIEQLDLDKQ